MDWGAGGDARVGRVARQWHGVDMAPREGEDEGKVDHRSKIMKKACTMLSHAAALARHAVLAAPSSSGLLVPSGAISHSNGTCDPQHRSISSAVSSAEEGGT